MGVITTAIITSIWLSLSYTFLAGILAGVKPSLKQILLCIFTVNFIRGLNLLWVQLPIIKILSTVTVIYVGMLLIFKRKMIHALGDTIIITIAYGGCVLLAGFLEYTIFGVRYFSADYVDFVTKESNILTLMLGALLWVFSGFIFLYKKYIVVNFKMELIGNSLIALVGAYGITFFNFALEYQYNGGNVLKVNLATLILIMGLYVGTNYAISNYKLYKEREQNKTTAQQIEAMKRMMDELRLFKHNYLNLLYGFGNRIETGQIDALRDYYNETVETSNRINNDNIFALDKIKVYPLYNLFLVHIAKAAELEIRFILCVEKDFSKLPLKNSDICQVLGIFLDNSREAAKIASHKEIKVDILNDDEFLEIYIYNTFAQKDDAQLQLDKEQGRGMGLIYCDNILKKYKHIIHNEYIESSYFVQQLVMEK